LVWSVIDKAAIEAQLKLDSEQQVHETSHV
jgi:hypothetical protein